jgi:hypothetical protein
MSTTLSVLCFAAAGWLVGGLVREFIRQWRLRSTYRIRR